MVFHCLVNTVFGVIELEELEQIEVLEHSELCRFIRFTGMCGGGGVICGELLGLRDGLT